MRADLAGRLARIGLAGLGAVFLAVVAVTAWPTPSDEAAYWLAARRLLEGGELYDASLAPNTPYAFWYPPIVAQVLVPVAAAVPLEVFTALWTAGLLACLWFLAGPSRTLGERLLLALALVAFLPVALELRVRNVHLVIAVLVVLAARRWPVLWVPATALKVGPVVGLAYLAGEGRWRTLAAVAGVGAAVLAASVAVAPDLWAAFVGLAVERGGGDGGSFLPVPYPVRLALGAMLAFVGGRRGGGLGEVLLVAGVVLANPTLWGNAFAIGVAAIWLVRNPGAVPGERRREPGSAAVSAT